MSTFYSSLIINGRKFPHVHQIFKPRYNKEYFKRISANIEQVEKHLKTRCKNTESITANYSLKNLQSDSHKLIKLKTALEQVEKDGIEELDHESKFKSIKSQIEALEDRLMPLVVSLPNRTSKHVPPQEVVLDQIESKFKPKEKLSKLLSHIKLSYINNCYSKSVIGPNSHYYFGIGAKLQYGLDEFFAKELERKNFIPVSGLCSIKSGVVEAANSRDVKEFATDPCRILTDDHKYTTGHVVEASRESLVGFLTTLGHRSSNEPLRLMSSGASYRLGVNWFDSDDKKVAQFQSIHALIQCPSIEQYSMVEYNKFRDTIWNFYQKLGLPARLVHCSLEGMFSNEYDAHRIDLWLPSRQEWIQASRVSHYLDFITVRAGMKRGHIIDSTIYDGQALTAAIIENNQTSTGKFMIPPALESHLLDLTESEKEAYLPKMTQVSDTSCDELSTNYPLSNYEQRRYLVRKSYVLGHSQRARKIGRNYLGSMVKIFFLFLATSFCLFDWEEIWISYIPMWFKALSYDYVYRPPRRLYWKIIYAKGVEKPKDLSFAELDLSDYEKDMYERRREKFMMYQFKGGNDNKSSSDDK